MKTAQPRRFSVLLLVLFAVSWGPALSGCGLREPAHQGKGASQWLAEMKHVDPLARCRAAVALGQMAPHVKEGVPLLQEALHDADPLVRWAAAHALGRYRSLAEAAVPDLRKLSTEDPVPGVRDAAAQALQRIEPR